MIDPTSPTESRKVEHLRINLEEDVQAKGISTGLESYRFTHRALPEIDLGDVDTSVFFLGHRLRAPILISGMTGGAAWAGEINSRLAAAAQTVGCAMGVGSQRAAIENPEMARTYQVRHLAPDVLLFANLGAIQLNYGYGVDECKQAVDMIEADALVLHLNPLQEALQSGGNTNFGGLLAKIERVCRSLEAPVIVKEVGWGVSAEVARQLRDAGVAGIDIAGAGGTSWSEVERHRASDELLARISKTFAGWGIPTAQCLLRVRAELPDIPLIASGGLRTGLDAAKTISLGAQLAGFASPILKAAAVSEEAARDALNALIEELRITMFCVGARTPTEIGPELIEDSH